MCVVPGGTEADKMTFLLGRPRCAATVHPGAIKDGPGQAPRRQPGHVPVAM